MIEDLHEVLGKIENEWPHKRLLVVGDVMLDKYIWGDVSRISPEAPVPVVRAVRQSEQPGGAANVAMNLARLGAQTVLVGFTGGDENEALLAAQLRSNGISPILIACQGFPTITKLRIVGGRQQMIRVDSEQTSERAEGDYERLIGSALAELPSCHAVVLSDYAKGTLAPVVCQRIIQSARKLEIPVLVDPKSTDFGRYRGATTICPNLNELCAVLRMDGRELEPMLAAAELMIKTYDLAFLTATLSEKGIALIRPGSRMVAPAMARQVFDVSGAGDTVIAVLSLCLACGLKPEAGVQLANLAAGVVVGKVGTVPLEKNDLLAALDPEIALHAADKVVHRSEIGARVALWKATGERVVFTNGCFDLLHVGHVVLLDDARREGERLVVGINSDNSVARLKGPGRPIVPEQARARVLAGLAAVDAVVVFDEPTPLELMITLRPDVIVKGGDYDADSIVGAPEVRSWGGRVKIVPFVEGFSTTQLIARAALPEKT